MVQNKMNIVCVIVVAVALAALVAFVWLYVRCRNKEKFCGHCHNSPNFCSKCTGLGIKTCPDRKLVSKLYNEGKLTEYNGWSNDPTKWSSPIDKLMDYEGCKREWGN